MDITPQFSLSQDSDHLIIRLEVPHVKISEAEICVDEHTLIFLLKPYYLKLYFEQSLIGNDDIEREIFDQDTDQFTLYLKKKNQGEEFKDLQLIEKIFQKNPPQQGSLNTQKIDICEDREVVGESGYIEATPFSYGFDRRFTALFDNRTSELEEICDIDPKNIPIEDRAKRLSEIESSKFDPEAYLFDLLDNEDVGVYSLVDSTQDHTRS